MRGRRVVITGVGRGLGRRLAEALVEAGDAVWGTSRNGDAPEGLRGWVTMELRSEVSIAAGSAEIASQTDGIDLLINCAGTDARSFGAPPGERGPFDLDAETFNAVMEVNAMGKGVTAISAVHFSIFPPFFSTSSMFFHCLVPSIGNSSASSPKSPSTITG